MLRYSSLRYSNKFVALINQKSFAYFSSSQSKIPISLYSNRQWRKFNHKIFSENAYRKMMMAGIIISMGFLTLQKILMVQTQKQEEKTADRIVYLNDPSQLQGLGLKGNTLIWYQCSDNKIIDQEVLGILKKFVAERDTTISSDYKIVIDQTPKMQDNAPQKGESSKYYKKNCEIIIVKPDGIRPIELNKYLNYLGQDIAMNDYTVLFNRLTVQVNQFLEINSSNASQFISNLGNKPSQAWIFMAAKDDTGKVNKKDKKKFRQFIKSKQAFGTHVQKAIITDPQLIKMLNISNESQFFIITPPSENTPSSANSTDICGKKYHILSSNQAKNMVFPPFLQKSHSNAFFLRVSVDANQNIDKIMKDFYKILKKIPEDSELYSIPKYLSYQKDSSGSPISLTLQKNTFDTIVSIYNKGNRYSDSEKKKLLLSSHKWKFEQKNGEISQSQLVAWYQRVIKGQQGQYFESENLFTQASQVPISQFYSKRITGQSYYHQISSNPNKPQVVFHFSPFCMSCKRFKHIYEQIAKEKAKQFDFYRVNNDENKSSQVRNYNSTPIFVVYKKNQKKNDKFHTFHYRNSIFTKQIFQNFLETTKKIEVMDQQKFMKNIEEHQKSESLIQDFVQEGSCAEHKE